MKLIFFDDFNFLDKSKWLLAASSSMSKGQHGEFEMYTPDASNCFVKDSKLFLQPTLTADRFGESFLHNGFLNFTEKWGYCYPTWNEGCVRNTTTDGIMPPVLSCYMKSKFYFRYGKVEIIAQMPRGDWLWPALWFMPEFSVYGGWPRSGEIDMTELLGNMNYGSVGIQRTTASLHFGNDRDHDTHLTNQHVYIDDFLILGTPTPPEGFHDHYNITGPNIWGSSQNAPFDQPFYIIMNNAVGGTGGIFPDNVPNLPYPKPWSNNDSPPTAMDKFWRHKDQWYSTWNGEDAAVKVQSVSVWSY
ncbi:beta-1,3-glucan-binding protein-like [Liolophura sinensis]|uniref:beta-1,3-glucan-binding protein-like n=1 Tax=Liolophura sinensis TaxID=3198878 RepID=UPI003158BFB0